VCLGDVNCAGQSKTSNTILATFELREARFFSILHTAEEVLICLVQIAQSLLWSRFANFIKPGKICLFQRVQLAMLFYGVARLAGFLVFLFSFCQSPIPREASSARMFQQCSSLNIVGVKLGFVGPKNFHQSFSSYVLHFCDHRFLR